MVISYLLTAFELGSLSFKVSMIIFILFLGLILSWGVFALLSLDEYRENKEKLFQQISDEEFKSSNILANYKVFDRGVDVFFTDIGIAIRNSVDLRLVLYEDILKSEFLRYLDLKMVGGKIPHSLKIPLITNNKIKWIFGGQNLKVILPVDDGKKQIIINNLREILK